ncbi:MAG: hypothetical protein L6R40_005391 [Gallowayella cf. fulva]|nr:MAG: hypothetical protein L6R40_005391 [Xanthomendoza cf. fulva]
MLTSVKKIWPETHVDVTTIMRYKTLRAFAAEIDRSMDPIGLVSNGQLNGMPPDQPYSTKLISLEKEISTTYPPLQRLPEQTTVFLTGATGFLGAYILKDLLARPKTRVIAHVRAANEAEGLERIKGTCQAYGIWSDAWSARLGCVIGDLQKAKLGLGTEDWRKVDNEADIVIHNGAKVHWVLPYESLEPANVLSTLAAMSLCQNPDKSKIFCFVSSTSVLDTDHYIELSASGTPVPESDDLEGSRKGLGTGYGQSKWVSEKLVREAGRRGLKGCIVRPGYVTGDSTSGVTNTDDFLIRHLKGCIQLATAPIIPNGINMVPVDHVARCVVACSFHPPDSPGIGVAQISANPRLTFTDFTDTLKVYGYEVDSVPYEDWKQRLVRYVEDQQEDGGEDQKEEHALMPLYHFVTAQKDKPLNPPSLIHIPNKLPLTSPTASLPNQTLAPLLSTTNTTTALNHDSSPSAVYPSVTPDTIGLYIAYLVRVGFLPPPPGEGGKALPVVDVGEGTMARGRGRGRN